MSDSFIRIRSRKITKKGPDRINSLPQELMHCKDFKYKSQPVSLLEINFLISIILGMALCSKMIVEQICYREREYSLGLH